MWRDTIISERGCRKEASTFHLDELFAFMWAGEPPHGRAVTDSTVSVCSADIKCVQSTLMYTLLHSVYVHINVLFFFIVSPSPTVCTDDTCRPTPNHQRRTTTRVRRSAANHWPPRTNEVQPANVTACAYFTLLFTELSTRILYDSECYESVDIVLIFFTAYAFFFSRRFFKPMPYSTMEAGFLQTPSLQDSQLLQNSDIIQVPQKQEI